MICGDKVGAETVTRGVEESWSEAGLTRQPPRIAWNLGKEVGYTTKHDVSTRIEGARASQVYVDLWLSETKLATDGAWATRDEMLWRSEAKSVAWRR